MKPELIGIGFILALLAIVVMSYRHPLSHHEDEICYTSNGISCHPVNGGPTIYLSDPDEWMIR